MTHSKIAFDPNYIGSALFRAILIVLAILPVGCNKEEEQATQVPTEQSAPTATAPDSKPAQPLTDLESLVAPIALYPDPLLAELLVASTYPLEVVQAARWLETKPDLATLSSKDWDASIMRLTSVPSVVKMMNDHLDWTTQLGDAFLAKPAEVMDVIQVLRKRAMDSGFLKDTPEQKVSAETMSVEEAPEGAGAVNTPTVVQKEVITIEPAKADTVYVPQYNPEVVYQAPMAPAPASTVVNVNSAAPASSYYPTYYPAPATTTTNDSWGNFATGAVVGGLLTWGIMEWTHHNNDYYVGHYYGNSVCNHGNCWYGGGGGYYGDRGNINYNRNVNISGNEINIDRGGVFKQNNLKPTQRPAGWQPDARHRRGQPYPKAAQQRLGRIQQPALAGQRLGAAQTLPATSRGFSESGKRPSSTDIRQQLGQRSGAQEKISKNKATTRDMQNKLDQGARDNALQGLKTSGHTSRSQSQRGANSRNSEGANIRKGQANKSKGGDRIQRSQREKKPSELAKGRFEKPQSAQRTQQQLATQRRSEAARPNAFETRNAGATRNFSHRGASSVQRSNNGANRRAPGGGGRRR